MTLPSSGKLSASQINIELGNPNNSKISLSDINTRKLANKPTVGEKISFSNFKNRDGGVIVTWLPNLSASGVGIDVPIPNNWDKMTLKANSHLSFEITFHSNLSMGFTSWTYLYPWIALSPVSTFDNNGNPSSWGFWTYPMWQSTGTTSGGAFFPPAAYPGPNTYGQNFSVAEAFRKGAAVLSGISGISTSITSSMPPTGYDSGYNGGVIGYGYPMGTTQTVKLSNNSSTNYALNLNAGYGGSKTPFSIGFYTQTNLSSPTTWVTGQSDTHSVTIKDLMGYPLTSSLIINGIPVTYVAPYNSTQADVIAGFRGAINNASISGVSSIDVPNGLKIINATSVSFQSSQNLGWANYTPTIV
jgi:hypothetical protein